MPAMKILKYALAVLVTAAAVIVIRDMARSLSRSEQGGGGGRHAQEQAPRPVSKPVPDGAPYWQARHETGDLEEYSWWRSEGVTTGTLTVVPDPTGSGHGPVLRGEITTASPGGGDSHRIYPALLLPECYRGAYTSTFEVWADLPPAAERGWISFATYTNRKDWQDLFGVNLGHEQGMDTLDLAHVPVIGTGSFTRISRIPFPMRQWVTIQVRVDTGGIMLLQDDRLVAEAKKSWGAEGPGLCEAHWGLYGQGKNKSGVLLNDNLSIVLDGRFDSPPRKVRAHKGKP